MLCVCECEVRRRRTDPIPQPVLQRVHANEPGVCGRAEMAPFAISRALPGQLGAVHEDEPRRSICAVAERDRVRSDARHVRKRPGVERDGGRRVDLGVGGDERVVKARFSSDGYIDARRYGGVTWFLLSVAE